MNTLEDLRATLDRHADGLEDTERYVRPVEVHSRIRAVRRRRTALAATAAALVVVAAVSGIAALREPSTIEPAGPTVLGIDVPETWSINEFPYDLVGTDTFSGDGDRVKLSGEEDDPARAVAFYATGLGSGSATLFSDGEAIARATGDEDAELPVPISNTDATLKVQLDGTPVGARAGVAVYTATDELAEGVSNGAAVFRQVVSGAELLAGDFSDKTGSEVSFSFTGSLSQARFATYCVAAEKGLWLNLSIDSDGALSGPCQRDDSRDAGTSWSSFTDENAATGVHTVRAYLTRGDTNTPVTSAGTVLGAAVYRQPVDRQEVAGTTVDSVTEYAGRTWRLERVIDRYDARIRAGKLDLLLGFAAQGDMSYVRWTGSLTNGRTSYLGSSESTATSIAGVLLRGDTYDVRLTSDEGEVTRGALLVYRPE